MYLKTNSKVYSEDVVLAFLSYFIMIIGTKKLIKEQVKIEEF